MRACVYVCARACVCASMCVCVERDLFALHQSMSSLPHVKQNTHGTRQVLRTFITIHMVTVTFIIMGT